jgi:hypothetical protein
MERILREQCRVLPGEKEEERPWVELKPPKDVKSDSLQSVFDQSVTYSGHKGKGLQVQPAEVFDGTPLFKDGAARSAPACTFRCHVEGAHRHDGDALAGGLDSAAEAGADADVWLGDTHYGSAENFVTCRERGIRLVSPVSGKAPAGPGKKPGAGGPEPSGDRRACCGAGGDGAPVEELDLGKCLACPCLGDCLATAGKASGGKGSGRDDWRKELNDARREDMESRETKALYAYRGGGESPHSFMKNRLGMKRLRVRGLRRATLAVRMITVAANLLRIRAWKRKNKAI